MHCLEYCYCLITTIIIGVLIIIIIVYHHYYHDYHDYYYHYHCYHQNCYPHLEDHYLKYYLERYSGNKLVSILTFSFLPISPTKRCQPPKTEMKSKYETGSSCTPVNKTRIKNVSCGYSRYTTLSLVSQPAKLQKKTQITFKNNKFTRQRTLSVPEHILLKRLNQFVITANVYLDTIKQI